MWRRFNLFRRWRMKQFLSQYRGTKHVVGQTSYAILQATGEDVKGILEVEKAVYLGETPWTKSIFIREFHSKQPHLYLIAKSNERIVAFAGIRIFLDDGHITNIAVDPTFQKQQLGQCLMEELELFARKLHCETLSLEVRMGNIDAQRFYRRLGFVGKRIKPNYYHEVGEDGLDMIKRL